MTCFQLFPQIAKVHAPSGPQFEVPTEVGNISHTLVQICLVLSSMGALWCRGGSLFGQQEGTMNLKGEEKRALTA